MYEFEHRLAASRQKKVTDIVPPPKNKAGKPSPQRQRSGFARTSEKRPPAQTKGISSRIRASKVESPTQGGAPLFPLGTFVKKVLNGVMRGKAVFSRLRMLRFPSLRLLSFVAAGIFLGGAGLFLFFELPRVRVVLYPVVQSHAFDLSFEGRTNIAETNVSEGLVPVELLSFKVRDRQTFQTTGIEEKIEKARGVITVYNAYSSKPQVLVERTRFVSESGHLFRTLERIVVPGAKVEGGNITPSSVDVMVEADEAGSDYNIGPSTFSIPGFAGTPRYLGFYGKSKTPMKGGFVGEVAVVSEEDFEKGVKNIEEALSLKADAEIEAKIPSGFSILGSPVKNVISVHASREIGEAANEFAQEGVMEVKFFVVRDKDLKELIDYAAEKSLPAAMQEIQSLREVSQSVTAKDVEGETIRGEIAVKTKIMYQLDTEALAQSLWGKKSEEVEALLFDDQRIKKAVVSFWPVWVRKVPKDLSRIRIEVALP